MVLRIYENIQSIPMADKKNNEDIIQQDSKASKGLGTLLKSTLSNVKSPDLTLIQSGIETFLQQSYRDLGEQGAARAAGFIAEAIVANYVRSIGGQDTHSSVGMFYDAMKGVWGITSPVRSTTGELFRRGLSDLHKGSWIPGGGTPSSHKEFITQGGDDWVINPSEMNIDQLLFLSMMLTPEQPRPLELQDGTIRLESYENGGCAFFKAKSAEQDTGGFTTVEIEALNAKLNQLCFRRYEEPLIAIADTIRQGEVIR